MMDKLVTLKKFTGDLKFKPHTWLRHYRNAHDDVVDYPGFAEKIRTCYEFMNIDNLTSSPKILPYWLESPQFALNIKSRPNELYRFLDGLYAVKTANKAADAHINIAIPPFIGRLTELQRCLLTPPNVRVFTPKEIWDFILRGQSLGEEWDNRLYALIAAQWIALRPEVVTVVHANVHYVCGPYLMRLWRIILQQTPTCIPAFFRHCVWGRDVSHAVAPTLKFIEKNTSPHAFWHDYIANGYIADLLDGGARVYSAAYTIDHFIRAHDDMPPMDSVFNVAFEYQYHAATKVAAMRDYAYAMIECRQMYRYAYIASQADVRAIADIPPGLRTFAIVLTRMPTEVAILLAEKWARQHLDDAWERLCRSQLQAFMYWNKRPANLCRLYHKTCGEYSVRLFNSLPEAI